VERRHLPGPGRRQTDLPLRTVIDTEDISGWYLGQRRTDLLRLRYQAPTGS